MSRLAAAVVVLSLTLLAAACGGNGDSVDAEPIVAATSQAGEVVADANAQYALSVSVPQYVDDIKSGTKEGGRSGATDKLIALLREHREALGEERVAQSLRQSADDVRAACAECAARLEAAAAGGG